MNKKENKDHPEVQDIKNICDIAGNTKKNKRVCRNLKKDKK